MDKKKPVSKNQQKIVNPFIGNEDYENIRPNIFGNINTKKLNDTVLRRMNRFRARQKERGDSIKGEKSISEQEGYVYSEHAVAMANLKDIKAMNEEWKLMLMFLREEAFMKNAKFIIILCLFLVILSLVLVLVGQGMIGLIILFIMLLQTPNKAHKIDKFDLLFCSLYVKNE